jgi:hypothetical protein
MQIRYPFGLPEVLVGIRARICLAGKLVKCEYPRPFGNLPGNPGLREEIHMRMLLRVSIPVETGNAAAKAGTLGSTIERILADLKPEAAYFFADDNGNRSGSIVFDMKDSSQIPAVAEPWFLAFGAKVSLRPVMNPQDLATAGPSIVKAGQQYGK